MIVEYAYAKINIALEVLNKREDGYHTLNNIMLPIDLCDVLTFEKCDELIFESNLDIEDNFIIKAANLFFDTYNISPKVKITLDKKIPLSAGLAGGSADASAVLRGLNRLYNTNITLEELAKISAKLGSDMPYCIYQKLSLCKGRGEIVNLLDIDYKKYNILIIKPAFGLSTKLIYDNYKYQNINKQKKIDNILTSLKEDDIKMLNDNIFNDLQDVALNISKELNETFNKIKSKGYDIKMSGSGPTMYILSHNDNFVNIIDLLDDSFYILQTKLK